jgi:hypothetical protein
MGEPLECDGVLKTIIDHFMSVPPEQPSVDKYVHLVNLLLSTYTEQRARLVADDDMAVWDIYLPPKSDEAVAA